MTDTLLFYLISFLNAVVVFTVAWTVSFLLPIAVEVVVRAFT